MKLRELSPRETEIRGLVAEGLSNDEIAQKLGINKRTVIVHISKIFLKLGIDNRASLQLKSRTVKFFGS